MRDPDAMTAPRSHDDRQLGWPRPRVFVPIAVALVVAFAGALLFINTRSASKTSDLLSDNFNRPDSDSLASAPAGEVWNVVTGTWGVVGGQAHLISAADPRGDSIATIDTGKADESVTLHFPVTGENCGLLFRYLDRSNYWELLAQPAFATWNVQRVTDGKAVAVANLGVSFTRDNATVEVRLAGNTATFLVNGSQRKVLRDDKLGAGTSAGLVAYGIGREACRWDDLVVAG